MRVNVRSCPITISLSSPQATASNAAAAAAVIAEFTSGSPLNRQQALLLDQCACCCAAVAAECVSQVRAGQFKPVRLTGLMFTFHKNVFCYETRIGQRCLTCELSCTTVLSRWPPHFPPIGLPSVLCSHQVWTGGRGCGIRGRRIHLPPPQRAARKLRQGGPPCHWGG